MIYLIKKFTQLDRTNCNGIHLFASLSLSSMISLSPSLSIWLVVQLVLFLFFCCTQIVRSGLSFCHLFYRVIVILFASSLFVLQAVCSPSSFNIIIERHSKRKKERFLSDIRPYHTHMLIVFCLLSSFQLAHQRQPTSHLIRSRSYISV